MVKDITVFFTSRTHLPAVSVSLFLASNFFLFSPAVSRSVTLSRAHTHAHTYIFTFFLTHILPPFHPLMQSIHCVPAHSLCLCVSVSLSSSHYFSSAPLSSLLLARLCCLWRRVRTRRRSALIIHVALRLRDGNKVFGSGLEKRHQDRDEWSQSICCC